MTILVTGASGFIGREVISLLDDYRCVRRAGSSEINSDDFVISDLSRNTEWGGAFEGIDAVMHLAALAHNKLDNDSDVEEINYFGTLNLARTAATAGVKRFVFVSSIGVNGSSTTELCFSASSRINPHNVYAQSKYDAEVGLSKIAKETGLEIVIVRPTLVYGANAPGNFGLLTKLVKMLPFLPFGLVNNKRSFIAVKNLADLLKTCAKHPNAPGHVFIASDGVTITTKEFTNAIAKGLNKNVVQLPVPMVLMRLVARIIGKPNISEQLLGNLHVDSHDSKEILDWIPPYTMEQAMASLSVSRK